MAAARRPTSIDDEEDDGEARGDVVVAEIADVEDVRRHEVGAEADDEDHGGDALHEPAPDTAASVAELAAIEVAHGADRHRSRDGGRRARAG